MPRRDGHDRTEGDLRGGVIALGNFDGFHAGHQAVVGRAVHHATDEGLPAIVATFDPHPLRSFNPDVPPFPLTTLAPIQALFAASAPHPLHVLPLASPLADHTAQSFTPPLLPPRPPPRRFP